MCPLRFRLARDTSISDAAASHPAPRRKESPDRPDALSRRSCSRPAIQTSPRRLPRLPVRNEPRVFRHRHRAGTETTAIVGHLDSGVAVSAGASIRGRATVSAFAESRLLAEPASAVPAALLDLLDYRSPVRGVRSWRMRGPSPYAAVFRFPSAAGRGAMCSFSPSECGCSAGGSTSTRPERLHAGPARGCVRWWVGSRTRSDGMVCALRAMLKSHGSFGEFHCTSRRSTSELPLDFGPPGRLGSLD
jgi:hypothetical protein